MNELTILEKDGQYAAVSRREIEDAAFTAPGLIVGMYDDRQPAPLWHRGFETIDEGNGAYQKAIGTSKGRGWKEVFRGTSGNNPVLS